MYYESKVSYNAWDKTVEDVIVSDHSCVIEQNGIVFIYKHTN